MKSRSNAAGYWNRSAETQETFYASLADGDGPYLRTGDLGFLDNGELHVAGRIKDLVIIDGVNHYPQDIEDTVERCHPAVRGGCIAAFAIDGGAAERVVVVAELDDGFGGDTTVVATAIRRAIAAEHQLDTHAVAFVAAGTIPKTSSGKIRRGETRDRYLGGRLDLRCTGGATPRSGGPVSPSGGAVSPSGGAVSPTRGGESIRGWLIAQVALRVNIDPRRVETDRPFDSYGLSSREAVGMSGDLASWLGRPVSPTAVYEHPTIDALVCHLSEGASERSFRLTEDDGGGGSSRRSESEAAALSGAAPAEPDRSTPTADEPVAIIGMGCRFPGAHGPVGYWSLLADGIDAVRDVPAARWDADAYFHEGGPMPGKMYTRRGGFLDDVAGFDPVFFGLSDAEARYLDPQQRLLLEVAWETLEDAGVLPEHVAGSATGVFIGITTSDYAQMQLVSGVAAGPYAGTGNIFCMAANRLSYTFDFRGPSVSLDTACSSSLVAIHHACMSLRSGESELALAGGVNLMLSPATTVALCQSGALSARGRCYTFDARADGYVRGEGAGLVLLKPLRRAIDDGDRVYAVIRGSAVNQDGRSNGLTAPSPEAHTRVIRQAYRDAGLPPGRMRYVEAHGTGTALGDPIEARALGEVLAGAPRRPDDAACAVGSVKTNFGHLEPAAGVAGLMKVALALHHGQLPPTLHFTSPNPHIDFAALGLEVQTELGPWPAGRGTKVAGVNSFGVGGTNAHVVLEEAPTPPAPPDGHDGDRPRLLVLSARTPNALTALAERFARFLPGTTAPLDAVCHTAAVRRTHHEHRLAVVARSTEEFAARLAQVGSTAAVGVTGRAPKGRRRRIVFVFPGQGPQYVGMACRLYATDPTFRAMFDRCARATRAHLDWSLHAELSADEATSRLDHDEVVQPLLFAIQVSLAAVWRAWGVEPDAVLGHSMGELAAAHVAGALTLADAARITCLRANLLAPLRGQGAMAVVALSRHAIGTELAPYDGRLHLAASNGPSLSVVSGDADALADFQGALAVRDVFCRPVRAKGAGHSPVVEPVARAVAAEFAQLRPAATRVPMYSSVTGGPVAGEDLDGEYWGRNVRQPVLFCPAIERLADDGYDLYLELSPNPTQVIPIQQTLDERGTPGRAFGSLARQRDDREALLEAFGTLYVHGVPVEFGRLFEATPPVASLPSGPWQHERVWFRDAPDAPPPAAETPAAETVVPPASIADTVAEAFSGVLRVHPVGPDDNFFALGGTSLMAAHMLHELRTSLTREIPLRLLFDHPTIAGLTRAIEARHSAPGDTSAPALVRTEAADFPLTLVQERDLRSGDHTRVIAQHLLIEGPLDVDALERALHRVIEIHDELRTIFLETGDGARQQIGQPPAAALSLTDLSGASGGGPADLTACLRAAERPFGPFEGPMYRFGLVKLAERRHVLSVVVDHIITDAASMGVLFGHLLHAYDAQLAGQPDGLVPPPLRAVDYAHWQRNRYTGAYLDHWLDFWRTKLRGAQAPRRWFVRADCAGGAGAPFESAARITEIEIDGARCERLEEVARAATTTMPTVVLTGLLLALRRHCGQHELTVPIYASGRGRPELERIMGSLATSHLVTVDFAGAPTWRECLTRVRDAVLEAGDDQELSMVEYARLDGLAPEAVRFPVEMNYLPDIDLPTDLGEAKVTALPRQTPYTLGGDIMLIVRRVGERLRLSFGYAAEVVDEDGTARLAADTAALLDGLADDLYGAAEPLPVGDAAVWGRA